MHYDLNFGNRIKCSETEKKHSLVLLKEILKQSKLAKKAGFLFLGQEADSIPNTFLRDGIKLIGKGYDYQTVEKILDIKIAVRNAEGILLLEMAMIKEGILSIMRADPLNLTEEILFSFLGTSIYERHSKEQSDDYAKYLEKISYARKTARSECGFWLLQADDNEISFLLKTIDLDSLTVLMKMETDAVLYKIYKNLSTESGKLFLERLSILKTPDGSAIDKAENIFRSVTAKINDGSPELAEVV